MTFCDLGRRVATGGHIALGEWCCTSTACVCHTEEDSTYRPATPEEAEAFWEDMRGLADAAFFEIEHDL